MVKAKQNHKFNIVDAIIILLVLAVVGAVVYIFMSGGISLGEDNSFEIEYVVEFKTIRDEFADNFHIGSKVVDASAKYQLGEVIAVNVSPAVFTGTNYEVGDLVYYDYPEHSNVRLTIKARAILNEDGEYMIDDGYLITVGTAMNIRTPDYVGSGYCVLLKKTEA